MKADEAGAALSKLNKRFKKQNALIEELEQQLSQAHAELEQNNSELNEKR